MKNKTSLDIVGAIILFFSTAIIPNVITYFMQITFNMAILSAIVSTTILVILLLIKRIIVLSHDNNRLKKPQAAMKREYNEMRLYSINGRGWASYFERLNIRVNCCTIFIRDNVDGLSDKKRYEMETEEGIKCWKAMLNQGRISKLIIYRYDHISDHYFAVFDEDVLVTGLNNFNSLDSTGQLGEQPPNYVYSSEDSDLIKKYKNHFDNYVEHYSNNKIYDSTERS